MAEEREGYGNVWVINKGGGDMGKAEGEKGRRDRRRISEVEGQVYRERSHTLPVY